MDPSLAPSRPAELLADPDPARRPIVLDVRWRLGGPLARRDHDERPTRSADAQRPVTTGTAP